MALPCLPCGLQYRSGVLSRRHEWAGAADFCGLRINQLIRLEQTWGGVKVGRLISKGIYEVLSFAKMVFYLQFWYLGILMCSQLQLYFSMARFDTSMAPLVE
eukprot:TRINITY_DN43583_c0_g1_i1.p3 TRINITY_DN43583_c0_g1~~TRINITY_DN43583_c0_g1_i1.p3  ORF type:complete len:102 (-),score=1.41 TRINITY_DN43583_c0_g1_i1:97-402(-)